MPQFDVVYVRSQFQPSGGRSTAIRPPTSTAPAARRRRSACSTPVLDYLVNHNCNIFTAPS